MINKLRQRLESFNQEISKEFYLQGAGLKDNIPLKEIYGKYPDIFTSENISYLNEELNKNKDNPNEEKRLRYLLETIYFEVISSKLTEINERFI